MSRKIAKIGVYKLISSSLVYSLEEPHSLLRDYHVNIIAINILTLLQMSLTVKHANCFLYNKLKCCVQDFETKGTHTVVDQKPLVLKGGKNLILWIVI